MIELSQSLIDKEGDLDADNSRDALNQSGIDNEMIDSRELTEAEKAFLVKMSEFNPLKIPANYELAEIHHSCTYLGQQPNQNNLNDGNRKFCPCCCGIRTEPYPLCINSRQLTSSGVVLPMYFQFVKMSMGFMLLIMGVAAVSQYLIVDYNCKYSTLTHCAFNLKTIIDPDERDKKELYYQISPYLNLFLTVILYSYLVYFYKLQMQLAFDIDGETNTPSDYTVMVSRVHQDTSDEEIINDLLKGFDENNKPRIVKVNRSCFRDKIVVVKEKYEDNQVILRQLQELSDLNANIIEEKKNQPELNSKEKNEKDDKSKKQGIDKQISLQKKQIDQKSIAKLIKAHMKIAEKLTEQIAYIEAVFQQQLAEEIKQNGCKKPSQQKQNTGTDTVIAPNPLLQGLVNVSDCKKHSQNGIAFVTFQTQQGATSVIHKHEIKGKGLKDMFDMFNCCCKKRERKYFVTRPPEPEDVRWENVGYSSTTRARTFWTSNIVTSLCVILSFVLQLYIKVEQKSHMNKLQQGQKSWTQNAEIQMWQMGGSCLITGTNFLLGMIIQYLSQAEKNLSFSMYTSGIASKLIVSQFMNSGAIGLFLYLLPHDFGGVDGVALFVFYLLVSILLLNPFLSIFDMMYFWSLYQQRKLRIRSQNQELLYYQDQLNKKFSPPQMNMAYKYTNITKTILIVCVFFNVLPSGVLLGLIYIIVQFWVDKYLFLRRYKRPAMLDKYVAQEMSQVLESGPLLLSLSNLVFRYMIKHQVHFLDVLCLGVGITFLVLPVKDIVFGDSLSSFAIRHQIHMEKGDSDEDETFDSAHLGFFFDYDRENPVTKEKATNKWVDARNKSSHKEDFQTEKAIQEIGLGTLICKMVKHNNEKEQSANAQGTITMNFANLIPMEEEKSSQPPCQTIKCSSKQQNRMNRNILRFSEIKQGCKFGAKQKKCTAVGSHAPSHKSGHSKGENQ